LSTGILRHSFHVTYSPPLAHAHHLSSCRCPPTLRQH
jgi:hypothetical protein